MSFPSDPISAAFLQAVREARLVALATVVAGPQLGAKLLVRPDGSTEGSLGDDRTDAYVRAETLALLAQQRCARLTVPTAAGTLQVFVDVQAPPPKLVVVGAVHMAVPLVTFARVLGFHTIVLDARSAFATPARFGHADQLLVGWPADVLPTLGIDEATYVVVLTHDEKIDDPALLYACRSPARYIGALGSRRTHAKRVERLRALGLDDAALARIHAPVGIPIGAAGQRRLPCRLWRRWWQ